MLPETQQGGMMEGIYAPRFDLQIQAKLYAHQSLQSGGSLDVWDVEVRTWCVLRVVFTQFLAFRI